MAGAQVFVPRHSQTARIGARSLYSSPLKALVDSHATVSRSIGDAGGMSMGMGRRKSERHAD